MSVCVCVCVRTTGAPVTHNAPFRETRSSRHEGLDSQYSILDDDTPTMLQQQHKKYEEKF